MVGTSKIKFNAEHYWATRGWLSSVANGVPDNRYDRWFDI
jgi:hypothetical protein